jgi:hypothetical protein
MSKWFPPRTVFRAQLWVAVRLAALLSIPCALASCSAPQPGEIEAPQARPTQQTPEHFVKLRPIFVDETPILNHDITIRNDNGAPVHFISVLPKCSCTGASLGKTSLAPNEETTLKLQARLYGRSGIQRFVCTLVDDKGVHWTCGIETTLYTRASFSDTGALHFGLVEPGSVCTKTTDLLICSRDAAGADDRVIAVSKSDKLQVFTDTPVRDQNSDGIVTTRIPIRIQLHAPESAGVGTAAFGVKVTGRASIEILHEATWNVRSLFTVKPRQVFFGAISGSDPNITRVVEIRRDDGSPIKVKSIRVPTDALKITSEPCTDGTATRLHFELNPRRVNGSLWQEVHVETEGTIQPSISIPVAYVVSQQKESGK